MEWLLVLGEIALAALLVAALFGMSGILAMAGLGSIFVLLLIASIAPAAGTVLVRRHH